MSSWKKNTAIVLLIIVFILWFFSPTIIQGGSKDIVYHPFEDNYKKISSKLNIPHDARIKNGELRINGEGKIERFNCRVVVFLETKQDIYDIDYLPKINYYSIKHNTVNKPNFISPYQAQLPAQLLFSALDNIDYNNILNSMPSNLYTFTVFSEYRNYKFPYNAQKRNFLIDGTKIIELEPNKDYGEFFHILVSDQNQMRRSYVFDYNNLPSNKRVALTLGLEPDQISLQ